MAATITVFDDAYPDDDHNCYEITLIDDTIFTLVTHTPAYVDSWIDDIECTHHRRLHHLIVGLNVEWHPNVSWNCKNPVAILQLCVGRRCLNFQTFHSPMIPMSLKNFLRNPSYKFVGVEIDDDAKKLLDNYDLVVERTADLRDLVAEAYGLTELRKAVIKSLTSRVLDKEINKPKPISWSLRDNQSLNLAQVQYAAIDAILSFEIGRVLISGSVMEKQTESNVKTQNTVQADALTPNPNMLNGYGTGMGFMIPVSITRLNP